MENTLTRSNFELPKDTLATKADIAAIEMKIVKLDAKLDTKLAQVESKLLLWAFVFWATQLGAIFAFLKLFLKQ